MIRGQAENSGAQQSTAKPSPAEGPYYHIRCGSRMQLQLLEFDSFMIPKVIL